MLLITSCIIVGGALALLAGANPVLHSSPSTLRFMKRMNITDMRSIVRRDVARAKAMRSFNVASLHDERKAGPSYPIADGGVSYIVNVGVGTPPTYYGLIVDTGSSNTWIGARTKYVPTSSSKPTKVGVSVEYGSGYFEGNEFIDTVVFGNVLSIKNQSIGVADSSMGFDADVDGILGIGPQDLTKGTLDGTSINATIPTVIDNAYHSKAIAAHSIAVSFNPLTSIGAVDGELEFGYTDPSKYIGTINYLGVTKTYPAAQYWGIDQSIAYGGATILNSTAGIVDTGTTLVLIATDAYILYMNATGSVLDPDIGLLRIPSAHYSKLKPLTFTTGTNTFTMSPNAQIWPRALNSHIGGQSNFVYLMVGDIGYTSGQGLDFINGQAFLERFYSVYDSGKRRVGLAKTRYTTSTSN